MTMTAPDRLHNNPGLLRALMGYDHETGALTWRCRPESMFQTRRACSVWNARYAGKPALDCDDGRGYRHGRVFRRALFAHRAAWMIFYGQVAPERIDHINGDPADNRIENLRSVTNAENGQNCKISAANSTGVTGVCWAKRQRKYLAYIGSMGTRQYLGTFANIADAVSARKQAQIALGYHKNHGRSS